MISYYTKVNLSKCNGSWVVSTKQTMNFNIQTAAIFVFFVFDIASTSEVWTSAILEWFEVRD
jgi:hypothetical protein